MTPVFFQARFISPQNTFRVEVKYQVPDNTPQHYIEYMTPENFLKWADNLGPTMEISGLDVKIEGAASARQQVIDYFKTVANSYRYSQSGGC
jgi:hypothetical protein